MPLLRAWTSGQGNKRCESVDILGHRSLFSDPLVLEKCSMVTTNNKGATIEGQRRDNKLSKCLCLSTTGCAKRASIAVVKNVGESRSSQRARRCQPITHWALGHGPCTPTVAKAEDHLTFQLPLQLPLRSHGCTTRRVVRSWQTQASLHLLRSAHAVYSGLFST